MDILGIGPLELFFIIIIALIVLGPKDMAKAGRTIGRYLRMIVKSDSWQAVQRTTKELRNLPNKLIREAGMEDEINEFKSILPETKLDLPSWDDMLGDGQNTIDPATPNTNIPRSGTVDQFSDWVTPPGNSDVPDAINQSENTEQ